jgi:hypothetical protein
MKTSHGIAQRTSADFMSGAGSRSSGDDLRWVYVCRSIALSWTRDLFEVSRTLTSSVFGLAYNQGPMQLSRAAQDPGEDDEVWRAYIFTLSLGVRRIGMGHAPN